jgi:hypothetical protein
MWGIKLHVATVNIHPATYVSSRFRVAQSAYIQIAQSHAKTLCNGGLIDLHFWDGARGERRLFASPISLLLQDICIRPTLSHLTKRGGEIHPEQWKTFAVDFPGCRVFSFQGRGGEKCRMWNFRLHGKLVGEQKEG